MKFGLSLLLILSLLTIGSTANAQQPGIWVIDVVNVKNGLQSEALYYYENNWKAARDRMLANKHIKSYQLLTVAADSANPAGFVLMTEFTDSLSYRQSEVRFDKVFKELRPDGGMKLLNEKKPGDFRQIVVNRIGQTHLSAGRR